MRWQILCDFDGTITLDDTMIALLKRFIGQQWEEIDRSCSSREARLRWADMLKAERAEIEELLKTMQIDPTFPAFLKATSDAGLPLTVVSDGYDVSVNQVLAQNDIKYLDIAANKFLFGEDGKCGVEFPFGDPDCAVDAGVCKCAAMGRLRNRKSVLIGNGTSDFCTAGAADFVFAKDQLVGHCVAENIPHYRFESFAELIPLVPLISGDGSKLLEVAEHQMAAS